jgi:hypothetical protein
MKQYLLSIYQPEGAIPAADALADVARKLTAFIDEAKRAGAWVFNGGLHPPGTAAVVRVTRGKPLITDGPFTETKEHIGGFVIVKANDLDAALEWARKLAEALILPGSDGPSLPVEVRPFADR